ncbi:hypothetical protein SAMN05216276_100346 [Streptosporangium subroseum]|uniref:Uncharacterized protein n=1 Tax=Streptosporangium subroseum TaxID=106412 RepID=A0A239BAB7_9ACTN|nr:hypothetical protein [Streptosporangium subroseum]SNS04358.1 hypothetical protein SAMN05216276_100346 [Streptosporangium subroseum]
MNELRDRVIAVHGGLDRWNELTSVRAHLVNGGGLWALKGQEGVIEDATVHVDLHRQFASHFPFGRPGLRSAFTADRVAVESDAGEVVEERLDPRDAFAGHTVETPWDRLHLAYFAGYAMWTYLTEPFSFADPGFRTEELSPWQEDGQTWRRLKVTYPDHIATHSKEQTYYIDADGLIRRHDYVSEVLGSTGPAAHYSSEHREFDGIVVPTRRRVHLIGEDGNVMPEPLIVSIDLDDIVFE